MRKAVGLCIAASAVALTLGQAGWGQEKPVKRALLVNATRCKDFKEIDPLGGAADDQMDVLVMSKVLKAKGFQVTPLEDDKASKQSIQEALQKIALESKPGDIVVFYFSGHGSYIKDQFSLCAWDANPQNASGDITESDLKTWLDTLKTHNVTLILDSCYSQVCTNGRPYGARYKTKAITRKIAEPVTLNQKFHIAPEQAVILSAANENGTALQIEPAAKAWVGLFTLNVAEELARSSDKTTYCEFMQRVRTRVQKWADINKDDQLGSSKIMQSPTVYGSDAQVNRALFAPVPQESKPKADATPAVQPIGAVTKVENGKVTLNVGTSANVTPGSKVDIVGKDGKPVTATVIAVMADTSVAVPEKSARSLDVAIKSVAIPTRAQIDIAPTKNITTFLDGTPDFQAKMRQALSLYPFLKVADTNADNKAQMIIKGEITTDGITGKMLESDGVSPVDPRGRAFTGKNADELVEQFSPELNQLVTVSAMLRMQNPGQPFMISVSSSKPQYKVGETATFTCSANQDCYIFLYAVDATGYPSLLYPIEEDHSNAVKKDQTMELPPAASTLTFPLSKPSGFVKVAVLAIIDPQTAQALKKRLLSPTSQDNANHKGGRRIRAVEDLQKLQLGPLTGWMTSELSISVVDPEEVKKAARP